MATGNPFDLLEDVDSDDLSQLIAKQQQKLATKKAPVPDAAAAPPKRSSRPLPPPQPAKDDSESFSDVADSAPRGRGRGRGGRGRGRGGRGGRFGGSRDEGANGFETGLSGRYGGGREGGEESEGARSSDSWRGAYGGTRQRYSDYGQNGFGDPAGGNYERQPRRQYSRYNREQEPKLEGGESSNVETVKDENLAQQAEITEALPVEKNLEEENVPAPETNKANEEGAADEGKEEEPEDKEMTLDEYQKILAEKRKNLNVVKAEERKIDVDKEFKSMQQLSLKKENDPIFMKMGSDKDLGKRKETVKKSVTIQEFLKPAGEETYYSPGGRGRGRGRRGRGRGDRVHMNGVRYSAPNAPSIEDPGEFPALGGK